MKLVIFGAAGGVGENLVKQAIAANHEVTAFVHKPGELASYEVSANIVSGDLLDMPSVQAVVQGQDAVLSAFGTHNRKDGAIYPEGIGNIIVAMKEQGVQRLICATSTHVEDYPALGFVFNKILKPLLWKKNCQGMEQLESDVVQSGLEWTIVRPGTLTDDPHTGKYRVSDDGIPEGGSKISRADVADLMLKETTNTESIHKKLVVVY